jgi:CheY-like chemotaxis protein
VPFASSDDGTGIGLFVVRDVLQQLGGRLEVQTRDAADPGGQGTTSTVSIPAKQVKRTSPEADLFEGSEALSVLVVDDLSDVRDSLVDVTRRLGHACRAVGSAAEARPLLASTHFDVALIDLEMPETDGLALATEIRESGGPNTSAMLILISAAENQATGQGWPFDGFLQKPIDGQAWPDSSDRCRTQCRHCAGTPSGPEAALTQVEDREAISCAFVFPVPAETIAATGPQVYGYDL